MRYRSAFCTLDSVIRQLSISTATDNDLASAIDTHIAAHYANQVVRLKELIFEVSENIATISGQQFIPYLDTYTRTFKQISANRELWSNGGILTWNLHHGYDDLIAVDSLAWGSTTLTSSQYRAGDLQRYPVNYLELDRNAVTVTSGSSFSDGATLTGTWGYHENPSAMWQNSGDTVQDSPLSSSSTSLNVASGTVFEIYQYIRIGSEYLFITDRSTNTLTVTRGVNGTTAAEHANGAQIDQLQTYATAAEATRRRVVYLHQNPSEQRRIVALPDGSIELDNEKAIPFPPQRWRLHSL
ncbi:MAG: hypothetical protein ACPG7F_00900 [Aggregatilineales bacterium]